MHAGNEDAFIACIRATHSGNCSAAGISGIDGDGGICKSGRIVEVGDSIGVEVWCLTESDAWTTGVFGSELPRLCADVFFVSIFGVETLSLDLFLWPKREKNDMMLFEDFGLPLLLPDWESVLSETKEAEFAIEERLRGERAAA